MSWEHSKAQGLFLVVLMQNDLTAVCCVLKTDVYQFRDLFWLEFQVCLLASDTN